jgi:hypothetical protein
MQRRLALEQRKTWTPGEYPTSSKDVVALRVANVGLSNAYVLYEILSSPRKYDYTSF